MIRNPNKYKIYTIILLLLNFIARLIIYFNTKLFYFHDYKSYFDGIEKIKNNGSIPLISGNFLYLNSYIGYFFKYVLGSIHYYFIFNSLLGVLASLVVYKTILLLTNNERIGLIVLFLHLFYTEFLCWSSIFYTPIIGIFLLSLVVYFSVLLIIVDDFRKSLIYVGFLLVLINLSFFFKGEMKYFYLVYIIFGLINFKQLRILLKFVLLGLLLYSSTATLKKNHILPYKRGNIAVNDFVFFGHTLYGGDGGDGSFIYEKNETKYFEELDKYCKMNNIPDSLMYSKKIRNEFQSSEMSKFITEHPFLWLKLQGYKFFRFFGVVPEGDSAKILLTGLFDGNIYATGVFLVFPFSLMFLLILLLSDYRIVIRGLRKSKYLLLLLFVGYYIIGSVFYGQYQERYRMPIMVVFLLPYLAYLINYLKFNKRLLKGRKKNILIISVIIIIWINQLYKALVINEDRYMIKNVNELIENGRQW